MQRWDEQKDRANQRKHKLAFSALLSTSQTAKLKREIEALKKMPECEIDTSDLPVLPPEKWAKVK